VVYLEAVYFSLDFSNSRNPRYSFNCGRAPEHENKKPVKTYLTVLQSNVKTLLFFPKSILLQYPPTVTKKQARLFFQFQIPNENLNMLTLASDSLKVKEKM